MKINRNKIYGAISRRETFEGHSAMSGERFDPPTDGRYVGPGRLSETERDALRSTTVAYVVRSYATPIAWEDADGNVHLVAEKFSPTTSNHQGIANLGLTNPEYSAWRETR